MHQSVSVVVKVSEDAFFLRDMVQCEHKGQRCCISSCVVFFDDLHQQTVTLTPPLQECLNYSILLKSSKLEETKPVFLLSGSKKGPGFKALFCCKSNQAHAWCDP